MTTTLPPRSDPAAVADSVRALARRAYRALKNPATQPAEFRSLLQQARRLRDQVRDWDADELVCWLEGVVSRLEQP